LHRPTLRALGLVALSAFLLGSCSPAAPVAPSPTPGPEDVARRMFEADPRQAGHACEVLSTLRQVLVDELVAPVSPQFGAMVPVVDGLKKAEDTIALIPSAHARELFKPSLNALIDGRTAGLKVVIGRLSYDDAVVIINKAKPALDAAKIRLGLLGADCG
jgi:hypothetical protein